MRKLSGIICALSLLLCAGYTSFGKKVDENTAKTAGSNFLKSVGINNVASSSDLIKTYEAVTSPDGTSITGYYVFNFIGNNGFIMVAADDVIEPILAYSSESPFNIDKISPAAKDWVEGYQNQIAYVIQNHLPAQPGVADSWAQLMKPSQANGTGAKTTVTFPSSTSWLLTTMWDQAPNYNYLCPGSGASKAVTGCVATAMAQVMKYWNWPTVGTGQHSYTPPAYSSLTLTANFGNTAYNWAGMPNSISSNNNAIGTLMLHAGISVDMNYSSASSGAYVIHEYSPKLNCSEYAFKTYFRYKSTLKGLARSATPSGSPDISYTDWINYLKTELNAQRPVMYSGQGTSGGHAWVADGYDASSRMHFNWGWGGSGPNGFYTVNAIAPPTLGIGGGGGNFNSDQAIIIGVMPDSIASTPGDISMQTRLNCPTESPMPYLGSFAVKAKFRNTSTTTFNGDFCAMAYDMTGKYVGTLETITGQTIGAGDSTAELSFDGANMYGMVPGTLPNPTSYYLAIAKNYGIRIMYRPTGSGTWTSVSNNGAFINYNQMAVVGSANSIRLHEALGVSSSTVSKGTAFSVTTKIANFGGSGFSGSLRAYLYNVHTGASYDLQTKTGQSIGAGSFAAHTFSTPSLSVPGGTYALAIQHQPGSTGSFIITGNDRYANPVLIDVIGSADINTPELTADNVNVYPNPATHEFFVDLKGAMVSTLHIMDMAGRTLRTMTGFDNQSLVKVPVADFAPGLYIIQLHSGDAVVVKKIVVAK